VSATSAGSARRERRLVATVIAVVLFAQRPGEIVADTKLPVVVAPFRFLGRALHLWDPLTGFGEVGNQTYGYLFPMGPFFAAARAVHVPPWLAQRAWWTAIVLVALLGLDRLAAALGIGTPRARLLAGSAYALSPAMLSLLGFTSAGLLPAAFAPWMLLPLVHPGRGRSVAVAAARSGLALAAMGAVNAGSVAAVVPLAVLWIATRPRGSRLRLALCWGGAAAAACAWWIGPLALQAGFGEDFLTKTERASATTLTMSPVAVLRGSGAWLGYLNVNGRDWLPGAHALATSPLAILGGGALAALSLYGLSRRDMPERVCFTACALVGLGAMCAGYGGPMSGPSSSYVRDLLNGPLGPVRNVSKLQPLLQLPLALGLAHAIGLAGRVRGEIKPRLAMALTAVVAAVALPAAMGAIAPEGSFGRFPAAWQQAAERLDVHGGTRTLIVPASSFAEQRWGRSLDEPLLTLADGPWASRSLIPLGAQGSTRLLDAIGADLDQGRPVEGLGDVLPRMGVGQVIARGDLDLARADAPEPLVVDAALRGSPGIRHVGTLADGSLTVWDVDDPPQLVTMYPAAGALLTSGGPEALIPLAGELLTGGRAVILAGDAAPAQPGSVRVVTDTLRRRDTTFGRVRANKSVTLPRGEPATDWTTFPPEGHEAVLDPTGAIEVADDAAAPGPTPVFLFSRADDDPTIDRVFTLPSAASFELRVHVEFLDCPGPVTVTVDGVDVVGACARRLELAAGRHRISVPEDIRRLVLDPGPFTKPPAARTVAVRRWESTERTVVVGPGAASYLATTEGPNRGWEASLAGKPLRAITIDGFRQGFVVPEGAGGLVRLRFAPDRPYRWSLAFGALLLVLLVRLALSPKRPAGPGPARLSGPVPAALAFTAAVAVGLLLAGWLAALLAAALCTLTVPRHRRQRLPAIAAGLAALAGLDVALHAGSGPGTGVGAFGSVAQVLVVSALAAVVWSTST
jgi:hypothetical protein